MQNQTYCSSAISQLNSWILMNEWMSEWMLSRPRVSSLLFYSIVLRIIPAKLQYQTVPPLYIQQNISYMREPFLHRTEAQLSAMDIASSAHSVMGRIQMFWRTTWIKVCKNHGKIQINFLLSYVCVMPREESCSFLFPLSHDIWLMFSSTNSSQGPQAPGTSTCTARTSPVLDLSCSHQEPDFTPRRHSRSADNSWLSSNPNFGNWHTPNCDSQENGRKCRLPLMFLYVPIELRYVWRGP